MISWLSRWTNPRRVKVYTDGAIDSKAGVSAVSAVVFYPDGRLKEIWSELSGSLTCNQAEYLAAHLALTRLNQMGVRQVDLFSDSQVMVYQMTGRATARAAGLRQAQAQLRQLVTRFDQVSFHHICREENLLADAAARCALKQGLCRGVYLHKEAK